ncbi:MAG TPA: DUF2785 domain-containing protein [Bryobacteraceae bacterium]|nr:DUF2785 domain-containing protein [Bryobacteraceae bacterium]
MCFTAVLAPLRIAAQQTVVQDKEFWHSIAKSGYAVPPGETAAGLARSLTTLLGSPDPEIRDEIGYTTLAYWIFQKRLLTDAEMQPIVAELLVNLRKDVGGTDSDAVLQRSFSALVLSVVAARDNAVPFLNEKQFRDILGAALAYDDAEKDIRGYDPEKGWIHSAAHTADLLKFLARSRYVTPGDQASILNAITRKLRSAATVFGFGEDERMARAVLSIVSRPDFDFPGFQKWLAESKPVLPQAARPQVSDLRGCQNLKNMLAKLEVLLLNQPAGTANAPSTASAVQETLKGTF